MTAPALAFRSEDHPRAGDGTFTRKAQTEPEVSLTMPREVLLINGRTAMVAPGEWSGEIAMVFQYGQCLAFAVAAAEQDDNEIALFMHEDGRLQHAMAYVREGGSEFYLDSCGRVDVDEHERDLGEDIDIVFIDASEGRDYAATLPGLPEQDFEVAQACFQAARAAGAV